MFLRVFFVSIQKNESKCLTKNGWKAGEIYVQTYLWEYLSRSQEVFFCNQLSYVWGIEISNPGGVQLQEGSTRQKPCDIGGAIKVDRDDVFSYEMRS